jgi:hypothetical protein
VSSGQPGDMTKETKVDWDKEISVGRVIPVKQEEGSGDNQHVQSISHTKTQLQQRVIDTSTAKHMCETKRYPTPTTTKYFF